MDAQTQQLVRLAELMNISADVLRRLLTVRGFDGERVALVSIADELERLADEVDRIAGSA